MRKTAKGKAKLDAINDAGHKAIQHFETHRIGDDGIYFNSSLFVHELRERGYKVVEDKPTEADWKNY